LLLNKIVLTGLLFKRFLFGAKETKNIRTKEGRKKERQIKDSMDRKKKRDVLQ
jgi:hypothetical protein